MAGCSRSASGSTSTPSSSSGVAHRADCDRVPRGLPAKRSRFPPAGVHRAERCPRECPTCRPPFETLLTYPARASGRGARPLTGTVVSAWRGVAADPPQRPDQPDVPDGVRELRPPGGLEVRQQVELAGVVGAVARPAAERDDAERVAAAAERPRDQVRRVDPWSLRRRRCRAGRRRRAAGCRSPRAMPFAAAAWFGAGVFGRAAGRAGEAGCASSVVPSSQVRCGRSGDRLALGSPRVGRC